MGLAGPRKRRKIGLDPNNTSWARSDSGYGHKILSAQGWTAGSYLGAKHASQSAHFTDANASHIRVLLKDDNLGLGAKGGSAEGSNFALASLQDLYGRLNGKSDAQLQKDEHHRSELKRTVYADRKWGALRFVSGGLLVGDSIEAKTPQDSPPQGLDAPTSGAPLHPKEALEDGGETETSSSAHFVAVTDADDDSPDVDAGSRADELMGEKGRRKKDKKDKTRNKDKTRRKKAGVDHDRQETAASSSKHSAVEDVEPHSHGLDASSKPDTTAKIKHKGRQRKGKLDKAVSLEDEQAPFEGRSEVSPRANASQVSPSDASKQTAQLVDNQDARSGSRPRDARLAVRQRFINQKRLSSMDPRALQEVSWLATSPAINQKELLMRGFADIDAQVVRWLWEPVAAPHRRCSGDENFQEI